MEQKQYSSFKSINKPVCPRDLLFKNKPRELFHESELF